ncbi:hypothetical protein D3C72_2051610 [compost metagenome]
MSAATSSGTVLTLACLLAISTLLDLATSDTGMKSFSAAYGSGVDVTAGSCAMVVMPNSSV